MKRYKALLWENEISQLFDETSANAVLDWLMANEGRSRVVLVGSGFTRNSKPRPGKSLSVPLWEEIKQVLAQDLRVSAASYDALTLADFYLAQIGNNALHSRLLGMLDDDALLPGPAHDALASYEAEAIITTNFLDTVLERVAAPTIARVVSDPDLALPSTDDRAKQLIYFHGHRSSYPSWVVSRSHYEDLPNNRPMIHARVRQLFAQFPLLAVGYSLTDPDFHAIYRNMVRCMEKRHPPGLALLPGGRTSPDQVARTYWENLGLRIAIFKPEVELNDAFARFFRLTRTKVVVSELLRHIPTRTNISCADAFRDHCATIGSALDDERIEMVLHMRDSKERFVLWRTALERSLTAEQLSNARQSATAMRRRNPAGLMVEFQIGEEVPPTNEPEPSVLSGNWPNHIQTGFKREELDAGSELVRIADQLLNSALTPELLAPWFARAVQDDDILEGAENEEEDILEIAAALWLPTAPQANNMSLHVLELCIRRAELFKYPVTDRLRSCFAGAHGREYEEESHAELFSAAKSLLCSGNQASLDEKMAEASRYYADALRAADLERSPILAWLAAEGLNRSKLTFNPERPVTPAEEVANLGQELRLRQEHPRVRRLLDRARVLHDTLKNSTIKQLRKSKRADGFEDRSWSFSVVPYKAWRLLRQVSDMGAPPWVRHKFLAPLLDGEHEFLDELAERLELNVAGTSEWVIEAVEKAELAEEGLETTTADVVRTVIYDDVKSVVQLRGRLAVLAKISELLRVGDVGPALALLGRAQGGSDAPLKTWIRLSRVCQWNEFFPGFLKYCESVGGQGFELTRRAGALPWQHWSLCDEMFLAEGQGPRLLELMVERARHTFELSSVGWAFAAVADDVDHSPQVTRLQIQWLEKARTIQDSDADLFHVMAAVAVRLPKTERAHWVQATLDDVRRSVGGDKEWRAIESYALVACELNGHVCASSDIDDVFDAAIGLLEERWVATVQMLKSNSAFAPGIACLLAVALKRRYNVSTVRAQFFELIGLTWDVVPHLAGVLDANIWDGDWSRLIRLLRFGGSTRHHKSWCVNLLELWRRELLETTSTPALADEQLAFLNEYSVQLTGDSDARIANHAAYGVGRLAEVLDRDRYGVSLALRQMGQDRRVGVRHAAAFAAARLQTLARAQDIRELAVELDRTLVLDEIAIVRRQRQFGLAQALRDRRRAQIGDGSTRDPTTTWRS
jgi:hypothetical protein